ncbi:unnamed protein product [Phytomonas sp. Hart1]|nr:unnamed protein product [Phytomonas sp. Hart1]|eukprot:CCW67858.1 unnamed protein product [Phytomonas sp. isolate Hart1]
MSLDPLLMNTVLQGCGCVDASLDGVVQCSPFTTYAIAQQAYYLLHVLSTARAMLSSSSSPYTTIVRLAAERKRGVTSPCSLDSDSLLAEDALAGEMGGLGQRIAILGAGAVAESCVFLLLGESPPLVHPTRITVISAQRPTTNKLRSAFEKGVRWSARAQARQVLASCDLLILACGTVEELLDLLKERNTEVAGLGPRKQGTSLLKPTAVVFLAVTGAPQTKVALLLQMDESFIVCSDASTPHRAPRIAADYHSKADACTTQLIKRISYSLSFLGDAARQAEDLCKKDSPRNNDDTFSFHPTQWGFTTANTASMLSTLSREAVPPKSFFIRVWHAMLTWVGRLMGHNKFSLNERKPSPNAQLRTGRKETGSSSSRRLMSSSNTTVQNSNTSEGSMLCSVLSVISPSNYNTVAAAVLQRYQHSLHSSESDIVRETRLNSAVQCSSEHISTPQPKNSLVVLPLGYSSEAELNHDMQLHYTEVLQKNAYRLHASV